MNLSLSHINSKFVRELRLQRDIAESAYNSCLNAIGNVRLEIDVLRSKLTWIRNELSPKSQAARKAGS